MTAISRRTKFLPVLVLLLAVFVTGCVYFGIIQTILAVAFVATAAMISTFLIVAASRNAY
ncbi:hypothetical protein [Mesorhizobium sp. A623]